MPATLVTGATGFLGKHLVGQLRRERPPPRLRIFCRGASPWDQDPQVEKVKGNITSAADVLSAMEGVASVYHLAGAVSRNPRASELYATHVEGTRNVCDAARRCGVQKIVLVSSSGTIAVSREPVIHDEESGYKHEIVGEWPYYLSKIFAEKLALSYAKDYGLPVVIVNPSLLLGPGDDRRSSAVEIELFLEGQILAIPGGGLNIVDVRDASAALIAAMRAGNSGERYLIGGPNWTFSEMIEKSSAVSGVRGPKRRLSLPASLWGARLLRRIYPLVGQTYRLDDARIKMSALFWYCNSSKARAQLGFTTRDPLETLRETVEDLRRAKS